MEPEKSGNKNEKIKTKKSKSKNDPASEDDGAAEPKRIRKKAKEVEDEELPESPTEPAPPKKVAPHVTVPATKIDRLLVKGTDGLVSFDHAHAEKVRRQVEEAANKGQPITLQHLCDATAESILRSKFAAHRHIVPKGTYSGEDLFKLDWKDFSRQSSICTVPVPQPHKSEAVVTRFSRIS
jgi:hypothetical protein